MPTYTCFPTATTAFPGGDWTVTGTTNPIVAITTSGDSKYIGVPETAKATTTNFSAFTSTGVPSGATIDSISITYKRGRTGTPVGKVRWVCTLGGTARTVGPWAKSAVFVENEAIARPGGGSWEYADLDDIIIYFECDGGGSGAATLYYDQFYLTITYTGGITSGLVAYTGNSNVGVYEGGENAIFNGFIGGASYPSYTKTGTDTGTYYWRVQVDTTNTFPAPLYSAEKTFYVAGATEQQGFGSYAKVTSLSTNSTYWYQVQIAADTATWTASTDTAQSFATLTQTVGITFNTLTVSSMDNTTAPAEFAVRGAATSNNSVFEYAYDYGNGITTTYNRIYGTLLTNVLSVARVLYTTNSTYTITGTFTGVDTVVTGTKTQVVQAPTVTATYSIATTQDSSGSVRRVLVTLTDNSLKTKSTDTSTRGTDPYDPLAQRLWTITKPGTVTETYSDNPIYLAYGTEASDVGWYGVTLSVTSVLGFTGSVSSTQAFGVDYEPVDATFTATSDRVGAVPLTVTFVNGSRGDGLSYLWSFGDTGTSTATSATVSHTYSTAGAYTVTLTATGSALAGTSTDSASRADYIVAVESTYNINAGGLLQEIGWHLLEDPYGSPCDQFTVFGGSDEVLACLNRRLRHFFHATECIQTEATLAADTAGVYPLPADLLKLNRVEVGGYSLQPLEQKQADLFQSGWETTTTGDLLGYIWQPLENLRIQLVPPLTGQTVKVCYVPSPASITQPAGCYGWGLLPLPRVLAWAVKWGVIADLLGKEGEMADPVRAKFAEDLYQLGIDIVKMLLTKRAGT